MYLLDIYKYRNLNLIFKCVLENTHGCKYTQYCLMPSQLHVEGEFREYLWLSDHKCVVNKIPGYKGKGQD